MLEGDPSKYGLHVYIREDGKAVVECPIDKNHRLDTVENGHISLPNVTDYGTLQVHQKPGEKYVYHFSGPERGDVVIDQAAIDMMLAQQSANNR